MNELRFFNPYGDIRQTENRLPHWQQKGAVYFVTFRLADALPEQLRSEWNNETAVWLRLHPKPWTPQIKHEYHKRFSGAIERWLDAGHGSCVLRQKRCSAVIDETLRHFDGERLALISSVIMPNYVHAIFVQRAEHPLEALLHSLKRFSARKINSLLGRSGNPWQRDYFNRLVRDENHFANCLRYIRRNPEKARLPKGQYILYESDLAKRTE
jgi:putative transposase